MQNYNNEYPNDLSALFLASPSDVAEISALYDNLNDFLESGINYPCWKKGLYPTLETAVEGVESKTLYVIKIREKIAVLWF